MSHAAFSEECHSPRRPDFPSTDWGTVRAAGQDSEQGRIALGQLCANYWYPLYAFARRAGRVLPDAEDLTQGFFERLFEKEDLRSAREDMGRFRSFLLAAFKHFMANDWDRARAQRRGGRAVFVSFDAVDAEGRYEHEPADPHTPESLYDYRWAMTVLERARRRLHQEYEASGKAELFRELESFLSSMDRAEPHVEIAKRHGISVSAVGVAVHRLRHRFGALLREEVAHTVASPAEIEAEIDHLMHVLAR